MDMAGTVTAEALAPIEALGPARAALAVEDTDLVLTEVGIAEDGPAGWTATEARWEAAGRAIAAAGERARLAVNFAIGDWYYAGASKWGSRAKSVAAALPGWSYHTVRHYGYVAERFPYRVRVASLSWTAYEVLAPEPEEVRLQWLADVADGTLAPDRQRAVLHEMRRARLAACLEQMRTTAKHRGDLANTRTELAASTIASTQAIGANTDNLSGPAQIGVKVEQRNTVSSPEEANAEAITAALQRLLLERVRDWPDTARPEMALTLLRGLPRDRREDAAYQILGTHQITSYLGPTRWKRVHWAAQRLRVSDYTLLGLLIDHADELLRDEPALEPRFAGRRH